MIISNQPTTRATSGQTRVSQTKPVVVPASGSTVQDTYAAPVYNSTGKADIEILQIKGQPLDQGVGTGKPMRKRFSEFPQEQQGRIRAQLKNLDSADRLFLQPKPNSRLVKANASDVVHAVDDGLGLAWIMEKTSAGEKGHFKREEVSLMPCLESFDRQHRIEGHLGYSGSPVLNWSDLDFVDYSSQGLPGVTNLSSGRDGSVRNSLDTGHHSKTKTFDTYQTFGPNYVDTFVHTEVKETKTWERWNLSEA